MKQLPQQGDQDQAQGLAERLVREDSDCLRYVDVVRKVVQVVQQGLVQELEDHLEDVPDGGLLEAHTAILRFEVCLRKWSLKKYVHLGFNSNNTEWFPEPGADWMMIQICGRSRWLDHTAALKPETEKPLGVLPCGLAQTEM